MMDRAKDDWSTIDLNMKKKIVKKNMYYIYFSWTVQHHSSAVWKMTF